MNGMLVRWLHNEEPLNICVIIKEYLEDDISFLIGSDEEVADNPLYLIYDFTCNAYYYALQEELQFIKQDKMSNT